MSEVIQLTPTVQAHVFTEEDLLNPEELREVLKTIPATALEQYGLGSDNEGDDTPKEAVEEGLDYAEFLLNPVDRMKREGYTITNKADYYWFGHKKWSSRGGRKPNKIIPHHHAGNLSPQQFLAIMQSTRQMSPTVSVHTNGVVYAWVPEEMRPWTTGSYAADQTALTLEIANDEIGGNWHISDKAYKLAVQICAEWCLRYGINPVWKPNRQGTIQMHKEWANTACPGPYLSSKIASGQFAKDIKAIMYPPAPTPAKTTLYKVQCGAFKTKQNAVTLSEKLKKLGYQTVLKTENGYVKVQVGAFSVKANAEKLAAELKGKGFKTVIVEVKS